jgi:adenylosuccinate lyase
MLLTDLTAIGPIDGRYRNKVDGLAAFFSEYALMRYRVQVEVEYFIVLCELPLPELKELPASAFPKLRALYQDFSLSDAQDIKDIELKINHDVKAVEYFVKEAMEGFGLSQWKEFVHFGLTSQDINNTAMPLALRQYMEMDYLPGLAQVVDELEGRAKEWKHIPMLARTHGQPASPTGLGKEFRVFSERLKAQRALLEMVPHTGKFGGATGNFNAHFAAYPDVDWPAFADRFLAKKLGLKRQQTTTQIEHYDNLAALLDAARRINTILTDLCRDCWTYISMEYFRQTVNQDEVGSSAMPHKVNPIDFENAEGNLGVANVLFHHLAEKLPISRLQRDLTDSTVLRNLGVPFAHTQLAKQSLRKGLGKLNVNEAAIRTDLERNWMVVAEGIQTILRARGVENPYEQLKALTRKGESVGEAEINAFIDGLGIDAETSALLKSLNPFTYTGNATK